VEECPPLWILEECTSSWPDWGWGLETGTGIWTENGNESAQTRDKVTETETAGE